MKQGENTIEAVKRLIIGFLTENPLSSSSKIQEGLQQKIGFATTKRVLQTLVAENLITSTGLGKATRYNLSPSYKLIHFIDAETYYNKDIDERVIQKDFNHALISEILPNVSLFTASELERLNSLQNRYKQNISGLSETQYKKELERLAIDLSWKSSQIEGNTYSLLETELLLKDKETAKGKTKDEAVMLLNHKEAIDFIVASPDYVRPLTVAGIEDIHSILIRDLGIERNIRKHRIGISGTNYRPLDNDFQIKEALEDMCKVVNGNDNVFAKALLTLVLLSYIQPFTDGNKRTARIVSNAVLIDNGYCPISFRTVDSIEYKKAMLIFYEQNNISAFKRIFIEQFEFAVNTYF